MVNGSRRYDNIIKLQYLLMSSNGILIDSIILTANITVNYGKTLIVDKVITVEYYIRFMHP